MNPGVARAAPRILVSLLTAKRDDIDLVRRRVGYRRLVLLAHPGSERVAAAVRESEEGAIPAGPGASPVRIEHLAGCDVHAHMGRIKAILQEEQSAALGRSSFVLNAAGGDPSLVMAMLLVAYEQGHETWFTQEGHHVRLPVLWGVRLEDRLDRDEEATLKALPAGGATGADVAQQIVLVRERVERALRGLQKKGLVTLYAEAGRMAARPTNNGEYVQRHLQE